MRISGVLWRYSYGEKSSIDGLPTSTKPTGIIITVLAKARST
jgi:hypothetical protein